MSSPRPARTRPVIEVQGPDGAAVSLHKCRCRQIVPIYPGRVAACRCGQRFRWSAVRPTARKIVVIGEEKER